MATKRTLTIIAVFSIVFFTLPMFALSADFYVIPVQKKNFAPAAKTGQTTSYVAGDDGDLETGIASPNPRFTDNGDGTITDNRTKLVWLKNADCYSGKMAWSLAIFYCKSLKSGDCGLSDGSAAGDWRLPNLFEMESLRDMEYTTWALPNTAGTGQWSEGDPFTTVQNADYWSSTTYKAVPATYAWKVLMYNGGVQEHMKADTCYVWPVRNKN